MSSGSRNESNSHQLARIGEKKSFHELNVHHLCKAGMRPFGLGVHRVYKVGIKRFRAQEAEMSQTSIS